MLLKITDFVNFISSYNKQSYSQFLIIFTDDNLEMLCHNLWLLLHFYMANHSSNQAFLLTSKTPADAVELLARGVYTKAKVHSFLKFFKLSNTAECYLSYLLDIILITSCVPE